MTDAEVQRFRKDFPLIERGEVIYFDNAATMQKPRAVIERVKEFYEQENANPLRGLYDLSVRATEQVEEVRRKVAKFMGAARPEEIVFTKNATEAINLTARLLGSKLMIDDEIICSVASHHSNFLPWVELRKRQRIGLKIAISNFEMEYTPNTKVVALPGMSNVTGIEIETKRLPGAMFSADLAQTIAHRKVDVMEEKIDFAQWSGHKIGAPMGVGVMYGRYDLLDKLEPVDVGGGTVNSVNIKEGRLRVAFAKAPQRFEAGTLNVEGIVGLGAAIDYWQEHSPEKLFEYVNELTEYAREELKKLPEVELIGTENGILAFKIDGVHPHDVAQI